IVVLYPIIVLSPIDIFSGNIVSGITIKANAVSLPTFIFKNVRYNQFLTLKKGIKRPIEIIIKFFITLKNETVLYICHKEFVTSTGYSLVLRISTPRLFLLNHSYLLTYKLDYIVVNKLFLLYSKHPLMF